MPGCILFILSEISCVLGRVFLHLSFGWIFVEIGGCLPTFLLLPFTSFVTVSQIQLCSILIDVYAKNPNRYSAVITFQNMFFTH